jgi:CRISPR-associated exonuclease Cas4
MELLHRSQISGNGALNFGRLLTADVARAARADIVAQRTPAPIVTAACRRCSLIDLCQPAKLEKPPPVARWLAGQLNE